MIFDTHTHYDNPQFDEDRRQLLNSLQQNNIEAIVNIGASIESCKNTLHLTAHYPFIYGSIGIHPSNTAELTDESFLWLSSAAKENKIVAIGEIGLDYHRNEPEPELQKYWFIRQLNLARESNLPIVIHSRDAAKDTLDIMKTEEAHEMGGIIHCFSYGPELAKEYLKMGFYLGIGGVLTFNNGKKLKEVVKNTPIERIVLETDCPYLAPEPHRGKRNTSLNLPYVINAISQIKCLPQKEVIAITTQNAKKIYRL